MPPLQLSGNWSGDTTLEATCVTCSAAVSAPAVSGEHVIKISHDDAAGTPAAQLLVKPNLAASVPIKLTPSVEGRLPSLMILAGERFVWFALKMNRKCV